MVLATTEATLFETDEVVTHGWYLCPCCHYYATTRTLRQPLLHLSCRECITASDMKIVQHGVQRRPREDSLPVSVVPEVHESLEPVSAMPHRNSRQLGVAGLVFALNFASVHFDSE